VSFRHREGKLLVFNEEKAAEIECKAGDWLRIDLPGNCYPLTPDDMKNYRSLELTAK
jgi:hypothetical protein